MFRDIGVSFTKAYSICYLVGPFLGLHISTIGYFPSAVFLIAIGIGLWISAEYRIKSVLWVLAVVEAIGCAGHFLKLIPWSPAFSDYQYISMAFLDLLQSMFLFNLLNDQERARAYPASTHRSDIHALNRGELNRCAHGWACHAC